MTLKKFLINTLLLIIDLLIILTSIIIFYILMAGGNELRVNHHFIRFYSSRNLQIFLFSLLAARFALRDKGPFLGLKQFNLHDLPQKSLDLCRRVYSWIENIDKKRALRILFIIISISAIIKILNAWHYYGFFSGDDVEIHEMTLASLFKWQDWKAWDLRNAFYPMFFIYPIQALVFYLGMKDPEILIFSGRLVVIAFSSVNIYLVFRIATHLFKRFSIGLIASFLLAFSQLCMTFGSSALPRSVSSTFILLCFLFLIVNPHRAWRVALAGVFLGIGSAIRFSEAIFIVPCLVYLFIEKRFSHIIWVSVLALASALSILGISDQLYWGSPFYSLKNIVNYTLVHKQSSRGYQSGLSYLFQLNQWTNFFIIIAFLWGLRLKMWRLISWVLIPLILLSLLPHKEPRYLIPIIPFMALTTGAVSVRFLDMIVGKNDFNPNKRKIFAAFLVFAFMGSFLFEMDRFRFRGSESAVDAARWIDRQNGNGNIAIEQLWRAGGKLYFTQKQGISDISPDEIGNTGYFLSVIDKPGIEFVALKEEDVKKNKLEDLLVERGFREIDFGSKIKRDRYILYKNNNR
ncbi:MAG: glycosyltransferase family 39 protein [Candidatus Omnitrophota bacterium]